MADPFNPDPLKDKIREMIGRAKEFEDLNYFATSNSMCFLKGEKGVGKTFLIRKLIENLKKDYRILYIDANGFSKNKDIEKPIVTSKKIYEKIIRKKGFILIMDNCNTLTDRNLERIKYHYDKDFITSVVFSNSELPENESIQSRIG
ncbi:hypothetical protein C0585_08035 [Candidatus Woesearchaeota archaeon]|nr:MAG: hypothetical protein C0585_08035 [Candidatus Woesearchaeota archaeon]